MLTPATPPYADLAARLAALDAQAGAAYLRHATPSRATGADVAFLKLFAQLYEARAAASEQNPAFAVTLLPKTGATAPVGVGLPLLPAGVLPQVDFPKAGELTVTIDVAGPLTLTVTPPLGTPFPVVPASAPTRQTATFKAPHDGVYAIDLTVQGTALATVYVLVCRGEYRRFRELSRTLAFGFRLSPPRPTDDYLELLACLVFAEAGAATGDPALAADMLAAARAVPPAPSPVGIYPYPRHA